MHQVRTRLWVAVLAVACLAAVPAAAQKDRPLAPGEIKATGPVKGTPKGNTFVLARRGGPINVDAARARIVVDGKDAKMDVLKGGVMVTVRGKMEGETLKATEVTAYPRKPKGTSGKPEAESGKPPALKP